MKPEDLITALGPFSSNLGMKNWRLLLSETEIIAWPYNPGESTRLGFFIETGAVSDPGDLLETSDQFQNLLNRRSLRTYELRNVESITLHNRMSRNKVEISCANEESDYYNILFREKTEEYRILFRDLYPNVYREKGFSSSIWGKILKW